MVCAVAMSALVGLAAMPQAAPLAQVFVPRGGVIAAEGDSLTYGMDITPAGQPTQINGATFTRSTDPYPEALAKALAGCARVVNRGFPGDRAVDGLVRWQDAPRADVVLMMYGSNDATNYGRAPTGVVSVGLYVDVMRLMIARHMARGEMVLLLAPPPIGDPHVDGLIAPYRAALQKLGAELGLAVLDPKAMLAGVAPLFTADNVHLSAAANLALAKGLASHLACR